MPPWTKDSVKSDPEESFIAWWMPAVQGQAIVIFGKTKRGRETRMLYSVERRKGTLRPVDVDGALIVRVRAPSTVTTTLL